jgi:hypothetical protein
MHRWLMPLRSWLAVMVLAGIFMATAGSTSIHAQGQLIDRIVARIESTTITLSDVRTAIELGLVPAPVGSDMAAAITAMVDRQLMLAEVQRFPPPEPPAAAIDQERAVLLMRTTSARLAAAGLDERRVRELARDTLRIQAYLDQRFGNAAQISDEEAAAYYQAHPAEFTRAGVLAPLADVLEAARQRASAARRQATIDQWARDLRMRTDVVENKP